MYGSPAEDWRALSEHYRSMEDEELRELAAAFGDLTPTAQQVLRDEMKLRRLGDPQAPGWWRSEAEAASSPRREDATAAKGEGEVSIEYTWKTLLCSCDSDAEAWQISEALKRSHIESWIEGARTYANSPGSDHASIDEGNRRVLVPADQLDEARMVLERPIPPDIIEASKITVPEYELPVCPKCGATDPVLESADPVNVWRCDACGAEWSDSAGEAGAEAEEDDS